MKINPEWKKENHELNYNLEDERNLLKEEKEAYRNDMKELKNELKKPASEWDCDLINNISLCTKDRAINIHIIEARIKHLQECKQAIIYKKYLEEA